MKATTNIIPIAGIVFIILKLTGVIAWSWLWVLAPFWIPLGLTIVVLLVILFIVLIAAAATDVDRHTNPRYNRSGR